MPLPARVASIVALLLLVAPGMIAVSATPGAGDLPDMETVEAPPLADCAPPCGYIWPRLGLDSDARSPYPTTALADFPKTIQVEVTYSWDMEQEGTGLNDLTQEMAVTVIVSRTPDWLRATLDQHVCTFVLIPIITEYDVCTLTITTRLLPEFFPATEEEVRERGHRLMLFAASEESGTFMKSYGLDDIRIRWDGPPVLADGSTPVPAVEDNTAEAPPVAPILAVIALAAVVALLRRRS